MKKMMMMIVGGLCCTSAMAQVVDINTKYKWSYAALSDTLAELLKCWKDVDEKSITKIADFVAYKDAYVSLNELAGVCAQGRRFSNPIIKYESPACSWIQPVQPVKIIKDMSCNTFLSNLIARQNEFINAYKKWKTPGTYVKSVGGGKYRIVNVILGKDVYNDDNTVNKDANKHPVNTGIYDIDTGQRLGSTWTNDMFINVSGRTDQVRGIFNGSYICLNVDVTNDGRDLVNKNRGSMLYSLTTAVGGFPGNAYDLKVQWKDKCYVPGQDEISAHTNGVVFDGKVGNLEWLGHFIIGLRQEEGLVPDAGAELGAAVVQKLTDQSKYQNAAEIVAVGVTGAVVPYGMDAMINHREPEHLSEGRYMGVELMQKYKDSMVNDFAKTRTKNKEEAYKMAENWARKKHPLVSNWECSGDCNKTGDDVVVCKGNDKDGVHYLEFVFDSICSTLWDAR